MKKKVEEINFDVGECPQCGTSMAEQNGDVMCNTCGFLCGVGLYKEIMANRKAVKKLEAKLDKRDKRITIGQLHDILDDKKTDPFLIFDEMMNYLYDTNKTKYKKTLKKVKDWVNLL